MCQSLGLNAPRRMAVVSNANLPDPDVFAQEIMEELPAALEQFTAIAEDVQQ